MLGLQSLGLGGVIEVRMRTLLSALGVLLLPALAHGQSGLAPQSVEIPSGTLRLKAFLWTPPGAGPFPAVLFNHGSGGADAAHTAGMPITEASERLGPLFVKHGYAFLYVFRRGHGPSADQAPYMQDLLKREEASRGPVARQHLQFLLLTTDCLEDALAGLSFLKHAPRIDAGRLVVAGHSFGGQLALLVAEADGTVRAAVTFGAAAASWGRSAEMRERLLRAVGKAKAPIMLVHAENDYSTEPGRALTLELQKLHKRSVLKIYPPVGVSADEGHNALYLAIPVWEPDVFAFLDQYVGG
jgi:carboxymethylenebutenolidase